MLRPSRIHHKKDDSFAKFRQWEFFIKNAGDLLSALAKIGLFLGILDVFLYIWKIGFMPSGLSLSDGITFVFVFLAVTLFFIITTIYGGICTFWLHFLIDGFLNKKWCQKKSENLNPISQLPKFAQSGWAGFSFFMFLYMGYLLYPIEINENANVYISSSAALGFLFSGAFLVIDNPEKNTRPRIFIKTLIAVLMTMGFIVLSKGEIFSIAMRSIGVRYDNVSIETTNENIKSVKALSQKFKFDIETCHMTGSNHQLILNANILWTGIGNRTLIELVNPRTFVELNDAPKKFLYVQFDSATIWPVYARSLLKSTVVVKIDPTHCQH
jgi:hypothetical protein